MRGQRKPGDRGPVKRPTRYGKGQRRADEQREAAAAWFEYLRRRGKPMKAGEKRNRE